jgi:hypothetical protein
VKFDANESPSDLKILNIKGSEAEFIQDPRNFKAEMFSKEVVSLDTKIRLIKLLLDNAFPKPPLVNRQAELLEQLKGIKSIR